MDTKVHNPKVGIYPATPDYVHALEVRNPGRLLFVSGTMGLDEHGIAGKTLDEQLRLIWSNLRTTGPVNALQAGRAGPEAVRG